MEVPLEVQAQLLLRDRFGFSAFRAGQREIVRAVCERRDTLAVMPTGGGKSLGYVLPALLLDAPVLVVSPLIALMKDQADQLRARGIPAAAINSSVPFEEQRAALAAFRAGRVRLLFVAPERFRSDRFARALEGFTPSLFAVDEAHCISEWGHDFRPDYRRLQEAAEQLGRPPILALTATATADVRGDIVRSLGMVRPTIIVKGFERPNLDFVVQRAVNREDKFDRAIEEVNQGGTGILYAATRKNVEEATMRLRRAGVRAGYYHAGLRDADRREVQERFADGTLPVVVATNAFGMGIDRADLRFVVHLDLPGSVEAYTQEAGRAGRDGAPARCVLLYAAADARLQRFFIETSWPPSDVIHAALRVARSHEPGTLIDERQFLPEPGGPVHPRAGDSALRILEEAGVVRRLVERGARAVRYEGDAPVDFAAVRARAERDFERLLRMVDYAERAGCHRAWLVNYFAGEGSADDCGACEGCRSQARRRALSAEEMEELRAALTTVRAMSGRFGRKRIAALLAGSRAKELREVGLDRDPAFGLLRHRKQVFVDRLLSECIALGLCAIEGGEFPVLSLTVAGHEVIQGRRRVHLLCFDEAAAPRARRGRRAAAGHGGHETAGDDEVAAGDPRVFESLRRWRLAQAQQDDVPAYRVLHNRVLEELARERPGDADALLDVKGIGPDKAARYGAAILQAIEDARRTPDA